MAAEEADTGHNLNAWLWGSLGINIEKVHKGVRGWERASRCWSFSLLPSVPGKMKV